jgi:hypothetical protein
VNWVDLWGLEINYVKGLGATDADVESARTMGDNIANSGTTAGERWNKLNSDPDRQIAVEVNRSGLNTATPGNDGNLTLEEAYNSAYDRGGNVYVQFDPYDTHYLTPDIPNDPESTLSHEVGGHAYPMAYGTNPVSEQKREVDAVMIENEYRAYRGLEQVPTYTSRNGDVWNVPQYSPRGSQCAN